MFVKGSWGSFGVICVGDGSSQVLDGRSLAVMVIVVGGVLCALFNLRSWAFPERSETYTLQSAVPEPGGKRGGSGCWCGLWRLGGLDTSPGA